MEGRSFAIAAIIVIVGSILIANTNGSPILKEREKRSNLVESSPTSVKSVKGALSGKLERQGRYYMGGYPYGGGLGFGGATASASASASASSGGMGMGYGGYPYMYGR